jgi:hypothetical protein
MVLHHHAFEGAIVEVLMGGANRPELRVDPIGEELDPGKTLSLRGLPICETP